MKISEKFFQRRQQLGFSELEVAKKIGLNIYWYGDVEAYEHEVMGTLELSKFKLLCQILDLEPLALLGLSRLNDAEISSLPRNVLLNHRRVELGFTEDSLGEQIGFYGSAIHDMEQDAESLESWCLEDILTLAKVLELPVPVLLKIN